MSCKHCGFESPEGFRFCGACGAPLSVADDRGQDDERKVISALFCDVVGSTERAEGVDPEDVRDVLRPYYEGVRTHLRRYGGTVEKFIGDAVCGLFGAPRTHGDDAERAVRAALAIRGWIAEANEADARLQLHLRLGVATGEAVVALSARSNDGEAMAWGDVTNTAARLQAAAPVDAILVDERTYRSTRHVIEYGEAEPIRAKGKADPVLVWHALAPRPHRGADLSHEGRAPFVGRDPESLALRRALERVESDRVPEVAVLLGEAGIGKSRLTYEVIRWLELRPTPVVWRQGRSSPYGDVATYSALGEIVKVQAGILETDSAPTATAKLSRSLREVVSSAADVERIEGHLRALVGIGEPAGVAGNERQAAYVAWRLFLEAVARRQTLVLVFDDVQWADEGLLDFVEHVLDWARDVPILVVCTARPEFAELRPEWARRGNATTIALAPLSNDEIGELVTGLAPSDLLRETREAIVGAASGNPLFAVEFVRMLVDRPGQPPSVDSVRAIIEARLDGLAAEDKTLLQNGAVVGAAVWPGVLARVGRRSRKFVERKLRDLVRRQFLIRVSPSSVEGETEFRFRHVLVRDVAYEQIPRLRKAEMHVRTAEWLESLSSDRAAERAEMLAHHYLTAYEIAVEAKIDTDEIAAGARKALRDAGDRALSLNAFATAERHYSAAVDLWPDGDSERPALLLKLGKARYYADFEGAEIVAEAEDGLRDAGDRASAAEAAMLVANLAHLRGESQANVFEHANRALALIDGVDPSPATIEVLLDQAVFLTLVADHEHAIAYATQALRHAEALGLRELQARALGMIGASRGQCGDPAGREDLEQSIAISEEIDSHYASHHCGMLADLECSFGDLGRCFELQARALAHAERFGHVAHIEWLNAERVSECYWTGRWDEALALADEFLVEAESGSGHFMEPYCQASRGRIRLARGQVPEAIDDTTRAVAKAREMGQPQMLCPALAVHARALAAASALDEAGKAVDELLTLWAEKRSLIPASAWVVDLAWALEPLDRREELRTAACDLSARTAWLDAALALVSGEFDVAADELARIGSRPDEALARLCWARMHAESGVDADAGEHLELARTFFEDVDAEPLVHEANALLVAEPLL